MRKGGNDTGIIANVFGAFKAKYRPLLLSRGEYVPTGTLRDNDIVGAIADAIAKNVGKLQPQVVRKDEKGMTIKNDYLARILTLRPCPEMSTYDFLYRIAADLVYTSNSFSVIFYNEDFTRVQSIQPITTKSFRIFEDDKHHILFRFRWDYDGETYTVPYQNVIHIKARYAYLMIHKPWAVCDGNATELRKMADTLDAVESGIWAIYEEHLAEGVTIETIKELMEAETWLNGTQAAQYFRVKVGEENTIAAAVQDYTKFYCHNVPQKLLSGENHAGQQDREKRNKIIELTMAHMGQ